MLIYNLKVIKSILSRELTHTIVASCIIFSSLLSFSMFTFLCALSQKSLGRIDIKMNHLGVSHFIEVNLMSGLRKGYFYRSCLLNLDMNYDEMILSIANTGLSSC